MAMLNGPTGHPSYETDIRHSTNTFVVLAGEASYTIVIYDAPLWKVVVAKQKDTHAKLAEIPVRTWPSIVCLSRYAKLTGDFSKMEQSPGYASAIGRAERSLAANWTSLQPLLEQDTNAGGGGEELYLSYRIRLPRVLEIRAL